MSGMIAGITAMPMRRFGSSFTKSESHRLWARLPATASAGIALRPGRQPGAERRRRHPAGAEHVGVGEQHLGADALGVEDLVAGGGVVAGRQAAVTARLLLPLLHEPLRALGLHGGPEGVHRLLVLVEPGAELRVEVVAVELGGRSGMAVGRDHDVAIHVDPPGIF